MTVAALQQRPEASVNTLNNYRDWVIVTSNAGTRPRILVCEDNSLLSDLLGHHLAEDGFAVEHANDGGEAMEKIAAGRFDAVVLDAMMPVCSGFDVLRRMKDDPATADTPVIMLTGLSQDDDVRNALALGVSEFMVKPFIPEELILRLRRLLEAEPANAGA